jgi:hypothetical protein
MGLPSGEVIARPKVARACGCLKEFQHYAVDKYRAQRLAKFQSTRCEDCVGKLNEEQKEAASALPKKGEAFKLLPPGSEVFMTRKADGSWSGTLSGEGKVVEGVGDGPQGLIVALARFWVAKGGKAPPQPAAAKPPAPSATKPPAPPAAKPVEKKA